MKATILIFISALAVSPVLLQVTKLGPTFDPQSNFPSRPRREVSQGDSQAQGRAASYNSKFTGSNYQDEARFNFNRRRFNRRRPNYYSDPCYRRRSARDRYGRDYREPRDRNRESQGRFFWDLNVNNFYPQSPIPVRPSYGGAYDDYDCGGGGGNYGYYDPPPFAGIGNFLAQFAPGGPLNRPGGGSRPPRPPPVSSGGDVDPGVNPDNPDDIFDPVYEDPLNNRPQYDDQPRPPRPGQVVGSVSNTVNNVIQTLSGYRPGRGIISEIAQGYSDLLFRP